MQQALANQSQAAILTNQQQNESSRVFGISEVFRGQLATTYYLQRMQGEMCLCVCVCVCVCGGGGGGGGGGSGSIKLPKLT